MNNKLKSFLKVLKLIGIYILAEVVIGLVIAIFNSFNFGIISDIIRIGIELLFMTILVSVTVFNKVNSINDNLDLIENVEDENNDSVNHIYIIIKAIEIDGILSNLWFLVKIWLEFSIVALLFAKEINQFNL